MATNAQKTFIANLAISKTKVGLTDIGQVYVTGIDDAYFSSFTAVAASTQSDTVKRICLYYETVLKQCLLDLTPEFAMRYADLGQKIAINKEIGDWDYVFTLPSDFLTFIEQCYESNKRQIVEGNVLDFTDFSHVVLGSDSNSYVCSASVTGAAANTPITGASYASYWTLTTDWTGVAFETGKAYLYNSDGKLFVTNTLTNDDTDSAYIQYIPYVQAGINDDPTYYPDSFKNALATRLAMEIETDFERRTALYQEYEILAKPFSNTVNGMSRYRKPFTKATEARTNLSVS